MRSVDPAGPEVPQVVARDAQVDVREMGTVDPDELGSHLPALVDLPQVAVAPF